VAEAVSVAVVARNQLGAWELGTINLSGANSDWRATCIVRRDGPGVVEDGHAARKERSRFALKRRLTIVHDKAGMKEIPSADSNGLRNKGNNSC
jgi:hypothetical protein